MRSIGRFIAYVAAAAIVMVLGIVAIPSAQATDCTNDTKSVLSHTWDGATGTVVITHKGEKPLCKRLYVAVAGWTYDDPEQGMWPQIIVGGGMGYIQNPGETLTLIAATVCGQRDAYADYGKEPVIGDTLIGPGKPYEAKFVHAFSKGPNTYGHDDPKSCIPQDVIMPEAFAGSICEIGQSSAVVQLVNVMSSVGGKFVVTTSDGRKFTEQLAAESEKELMFPYEGTIIITVKAIFGEDVYEILEQELTDEGCIEPPIVVSKPKVTIGDAKCVAGYPGASLVTLDNSKSTVENPRPNSDDMSAATSSFEVRGSNGFRVIVRVPAGQIEKIKVPLAEDKAVTVTVKDTKTGKVLAQRTMTANCQNDAKPPTTSPKPPDELAETGAGDVRYNLIAGIAILLVGIAALFFTRRKEAPAI